MNYTNYTTGYKMTESFAGNARCHTETLWKRGGWVSQCKILIYEIVNLQSYFYCPFGIKKRNVTCLEIKVNNSDILMRSTTLSHHKAIYCTLCHKMIMHNLRFVVSWPLHSIRRCTTHYSDAAKPTTQIQLFFNEIMAWWLKKSKAVQTCSSSAFSILQVALFCKSVQLTKCSQERCVHKPSCCFLFFP